VNAKRVDVTIDRENGVPIYSQLAKQLSGAIIDGTLRPGEVFETEMALAGRLGVSRLTVRKSISELVSAGLLVRRRGSGTVVAQEVVRRRNELALFLDGLPVVSGRPETRILGLGADVCARASRALGLGKPSRMARLRRLQLNDGCPMAVLNNWLPGSFVGISPASLKSMGLYHFMQSHGCFPSTACQSIGSRQASSSECELLELGRAEPVLAVTRRTFNASGSPVEYGEYVCRVSLFAFDVSIHSSGSDDIFDLAPDLTMRLNA
jgi:GntR family transcriptional regulator